MRVVTLMPTLQIIKKVFLVHKNVKMLNKIRFDDIDSEIDDETSPAKGISNNQLKKGETHLCKNRT